MAIAIALVAVLMCLIGFWRRFEERYERLALIRAVRSGSLDRVRHAGTRYLNIRDEDGWSPLAIAAEQGPPETVQWLLVRSASPEEEVHGNTPLTLAVHRRSRHVVTALLRGGANPNHVPAEGLSPLMEATLAQWHEGIRLLLRFGADPNAPGGGEAKPLLLAVENGCPDCTMLLLKAGADRTAKASDGTPIRDLAFKKGLAWVWSR